MKRKGALEDQQHDGKSVMTNNTNFDISDFTYSEIKPERSQNRSRQQQLFKKKTIQDQQEMDDMSFEERSYNIGGGKAKRMQQKDHEKSEMLDVSEDSSRSSDNKSQGKSQKRYKNKHSKDDKGGDDIEEEDKEEEADTDKEQDIMVFKNDFKGKNKFQAQYLTNNVEQKKGNGSSIKDISPSYSGIDFYKKNTQQQQDSDDEEEESKHDNNSMEVEENNFYNPFKQRDKQGDSNRQQKDEIGESLKKVVGNKFAKQKSNIVEEKQQDEEQDQDYQQVQQDTNIDQLLNKQKKKQRLDKKTDHFFDFTEETLNQDQLAEEGLPVEELEALNNYLAIQNLKQIKKRKHKAKQIRILNHFYTGRCFLLFHIVQNLIFWLTVIIFPVISVTGCINGHHYMSHVAMGLFLGITLICDIIFAGQYLEKESLKFDLRSVQNGKRRKYGKCNYMLLVFTEAVFELVMTQIGLLDIYTDVAFVTIVQQEESLSDLYSWSAASIILIMIPKFYSALLLLMMMCTCAKHEDKRRKYAFRILTFDEFRMQALNVEYIGYEKQKVDLIMGFLKFFIEDLPQVLIQAYYLTQTDCGKKNANIIIYLGIIIAVLNTYFGLIYRIIGYCYALKRLNGFKHKLEVRVSNLSLSRFGFRHIRDKIKSNRRTESFVFTGENYEYMVVNDQSVNKFTKFVEQFPHKDNIEFLDINKILIDNVRQAKVMLVTVDSNLKQLRFLNLQQCKLCPSFILQFKTFLDGNDSLIRITLAMNNMPVEECLEVMETSLEHPNLEILQIAERNQTQDLITDEIGNEKANLNEVNINTISICKGIQVRLASNESLKKLEIRFLTLNRQVLQALFKGLKSNKFLQKLIMTHEVLQLATATEFKLLGEALKQNDSLYVLDVSSNSNFDEKLNFHTHITDGLLSARCSRLERIYVTTSSFDIKAHYLEIMDQKPDIIIFVNDKVLEDVEVQDK